MGTFQDLTVYKKAYQNAMDIFQVSKSFPVEERHSLTDQIRRSSRSVCANIARGYRKRQYAAHFASKMSDADMENAETLVWINFAFDCRYIDQEKKRILNKLKCRSWKASGTYDPVPGKIFTGERDVKRDVRILFVNCQLITAN